MLIVVSHNVSLSIPLTHLLRSSHSSHHPIGTQFLCKIWDQHSLVYKTREEIRLDVKIGGLGDRELASKFSYKTSSLTVNPRKLTSLFLR
jgi:hypothetical protein